MCNGVRSFLTAWMKLTGDGGKAERRRQEGRVENIEFKKCHVKI